MATNSYHLTSSVVKPTANGYYPYHTCELLYPHEALRREMARCLSALRALTVRQHPWKAHCFAKWFSEFFYPAILEHHHFEEEILFEYYQRLGAVIPEKLSVDHHTITTTLDSLLEKTRSMLERVKASEMDEACSLAAEIAASYETWYVLTLEHLAEEERDWPSIFAKYGEKRCKECMSLIIQEGVANGGRTFQEFGCSVLNALGYEFRGYPLRPDEKGWGGSVLRDRVLCAFPSPVRVALLPQWNKRYHIWKGMILSVAGSVDHFHLQDKPEYYPSTNCTIV